MQHRLRHSGAIGNRIGSSLSRPWDAQTPLLLVAITYSDTRIDLSWTNVDTTGDGVAIERSTDGVTYTEIDTVALGVDDYSDNTCVGNTLYYYRVRAYKGARHSDYSNVDSDTTLLYYYVSNTGDDADDGLTPTTAWLTVTKVTSSAFLPGNKVLFKKGDTWRETLTVSSAGTSGNQITFGSYGTGNRPRLLGSNQALAFEDQTGNVWKSTTTFTNPVVTATIFFVGLDGVVHWGREVADLVSLVQEYDWVWIANYIYVYAASDPDIRYASVEVPQRSNIIDTASKQYITIDGLALLYSGYIGINDGNYPDIVINGLIVSDCEIAYIGDLVTAAGYGTSAIYSNSLFQNNIIHDCGRRGISLNCYGNITVQNIIVEGCTFYAGNHTTGVDIYADTNTTVNNVTVRRNLFYDDPAMATQSQHIFVQKASGGAALINVNIYCNIFKYPSGSGIQLERVGSANIYHNTFFEHSNTFTSNNSHIAVTLSTTSVVIKNNIFYSTKANDPGGRELYVSTTVSLAQVTADYNLYYRTSNSLRVIMANDVSYHMNDKATIIAVLGWEVHGVFADPQFVSASNYHLLNSSPAKGAGLAIAGITEDYDNVDFASPPSIGTYEYAT